MMPVLPGPSSDCVPESEGFAETGRETGRPGDVAGWLAATRSRRFWAQCGGGRRIIRSLTVATQVLLRLYP